MGGWVLFCFGIFVWFFCLLGFFCEVGCFVPPGNLSLLTGHGSFL